MKDNPDTVVIRLLATNGRATWAELAEKLGVSAPAAADRVRRLEERGVIRGYTALVDSESLGWTLLAFVAVKLGGLKQRDEFLRLIRKNPRVTECHHLAGEDDFLLKVRAESTKDLERLLVEELKPLPGVVATRTSIVLGTEKEEAGMTSISKAKATAGCGLLNLEAK